MKIETNEDVVGFDVYRLSLDALVRDIDESFTNTELRTRWLACINPHSYVVAQANNAFKAALRSADWLVPDGAGIVLASRTLGGTIRKRITGPDLFSAVSTHLNKRGPFSALFVGSTPATLAEIERRYQIDFPNAHAINTFSPPFREMFEKEDVARIREVINRHKPDLLWIGLTAPKQELLLQQLRGNADFSFGAAIGAEFDFYAGNIKRAHWIFRKTHLEWLPRLLQEPRRLWRRTFVSAPIFIRDVIRAALANRKRSRA
jgi:N-acetylglucosaminyldiphosphoundecaprenol N-acetyl-beta-D-mannosaminyltransferase